MDDPWFRKHPWFIYLPIRREGVAALAAMIAVAAPCLLIFILCGDRAPVLSWGSAIVGVAGFLRRSCGGGLEARAQLWRGRRSPPRRALHEVWLHRSGDLHAAGFRRDDGADEHSAMIRISAFDPLQTFVRCSKSGCWLQKGDHGISRALPRAVRAWACL